MGYRGPITNDMLAGDITVSKLAAANAQAISETDFTIAHSDKSVVLLTLDGLAQNFVSDSTTGIAAGTIVGQRLLIVVSDLGILNTLTLQDAGNVSLSGDWSAQLAGQSILLMWDGSVWTELSRGLLADNIATGKRAVCLGGSCNDATGENSAALGGYGNANSGNGTGSVGGSTNANSELYAGSAGGVFVTNSGGYSGSAGGYYNTNSGGFTASVGGFRSVARLIASQAQACGQFSTSGDAQHTRCIARIATSDQSLHVMYLNGINQWYTLEDETLHAVTLTVAARMDTGGGQCAMFKRMLTIERTGGTVTLQNSIQTIGTDINPGGHYTISISADDVNKAMKIEVKHDDGVGAKNVRWTAAIEAVEIKYSD